MLGRVRHFLMKDFQTFLSLAVSLLTFLSVRSLLITSFQVKNDNLVLLNRLVKQILTQETGKTFFPIFLRCFYNVVALFFIFLPFNSFQGNQFLLIETSFYYILNVCSISKTPSSLCDNYFQDGITAFNLSPNSTRKHAFYFNQSSIFTANHYFCLLNIQPQPF